VTAAIRPEVAVQGRDLLGECPVWLAGESRLMWVDGSGRRIQWLDTSTGAVERMELDREVGSVAPASGGSIVAALRHDFAMIDRSHALTVVAGVERDLPGNRMNDGKCDSRGRFWAGSWTLDLSPAASLYRLNADFSVEVMRAPVTCSNGLGWSPDDRLMYYIDSTTYRVDVFDYDADSGDIRERPPLVELAESTGMPDGLTVDADGCLWVCLWGGSAVHRYDPKGRLDMVLELPTANVTSCTFGGEDLRDLYITTAREDLDEQALAAQPEAGSLFVCRPGAVGTPANAFAGVAYPA
jgi:sugar lactone lactonase YvrE